MRLQDVICCWAICAALSAAQLGCKDGTTANRIDKEAAAQIALKELPGGYIVGEALEMDLDRTVYRIHLQNAEEARRVTVDVETGRLLEVKDVTAKLQEAKAREENVPEPISLSHRDAAEYAALQAVPGTVRKWKAQRENGRLVFKFNVAGAGGEEKRVTVDARSQEIIGTVALARENR